MKKITINYKNVIVFIFFIIVSTPGFSQILQVNGNNSTISNGDSTPNLSDFTDFGSVQSGSKFSRTFVLKNTGTANLVFPTTSVVISGANANQYSITTNVILVSTTYGKYSANNLSAGNYTIIEISFNPTSTGAKNATITINLTTGSPKPYTFAIKGTATAAVASNFTMSQVVPNTTFNYPYSLIYGPDDYLWLTERVGKKINRVNKSTGAVDLLVNLGSLVYQTGGQDGLMGMVLHPNLGKGTNEDYVYVAYSYSNTGAAESGSTNDATRRTKIVRYSYTGGGTNGTLNNPIDVITGLSSSNDHNSGKLAIGPDMKLYYSIGDLGVNQFDNKCNVSHAQLLPSQAEITAKDYRDYQGKILRMNLDGTIPTDNPVLNTVKSHIYTYGHRNAQGLVFNKNGTLYSSEHGPKSDDEINILKSGGNYGWPYISGYKDDKNYTFCDWSTVTNCNAAAFSDYDFPASATTYKESDWNVPFTSPITTLFTIDDGFNFTGGWLTWPTIGPSSAKIYEGFNSQIPDWDNSIFMTTLKKGRIYRQKLSADGTGIVGTPEELFYTQNRYRDVAFDPDGKTVYIITDSGGTTSGPSGSSSLGITNGGTILKFVYNPTLVTCVAPVPDVMTLPNLTGTCSVDAPTAPTATNSCSGRIVGTTTTVFPITKQGTTVVTWIYNYGSGNTITQDQNIIVNDVIAPVCSTKDITIMINGAETKTITANDIDNGSTDNCGINAKTLSKYSFTSSDAGINTITFTATDFNGNSSYKSAYVTVQTNTLSTTTANSNNFLIYPVPFDSNLNINLPDSYNEQVIYIQIFDMTGKLVYNKKQSITAKTFSINDLSNIKQGNYIINLLDTNKKSIQKNQIIKKSPL